MPQIHIARKPAGVAPGPPPLTTKAANLAVSLARWTAAGFPKRTPERIAEILAICGACEFFKDGSCMSCGCQLASKASMATESCPLPEPKWSAEIES